VIGGLAERDTSERLSPDDMATLRDEQFLQAGLLAQQAAAARAPKGRAGTCSNCGEACLPSAVYCDEDCRADHQHRLTVQQRQRGRRG